ncbi:universal stress protein [Mycobacterium hodleri]|uniref:universal stress protein n=1 Tax=Mycolicibacterium hodleri TaxID=49897 RepID=UPI0021F30087|nr:universal stress protein [Mycolicibacterium hodleri]MCV7137028.1 universal stress protein [Mycolicibacterium hodleri]
MATSETRAPVVVGVDGSVGATDAARWAAALADGLHAPLHIVTATPYVGHAPSEVAMAARSAAMADHHDWADRYLEAARAAVHADRPDLTVTTASSTESAEDALATATRSARLLVLGCDDVSALGALLVGSTALATLARAHCPVVAWRGGSVAPSHRPILVGVDGSGRDGGALGLAFELADRLDAPLWVVHSWALKGFAQVHRPSVVDWDANTKGQWARLDELVEPWHERHPAVHVTRIGESAKASHALALHAACAQMVVVGRRRHDSLGPGALGSTGANLLHHCAVPVILCPFDTGVRADGRPTEVVVE